MRPGVRSYENIMLQNLSVEDTQSRSNILNIRGIHRNKCTSVCAKIAKSKLEMLHRTNFIS